MLTLKKVEPLSVCIVFLYILINHVISYVTTHKALNRFNFLSLRYIYIELHVKKLKSREYYFNDVGLCFRMGCREANNKLFLFDNKNWLKRSITIL